MRAHVEFQPALYRDWCNVRVYPESDLFLVLDVLIPSGRLIIKLSGQQVDEVDKALRALRRARSSVRGVS